MEMMGFRVKKPYKDGGVEVDVGPGESRIILFKVICESMHEKMVFPPASLKIYELWNV